MRLSDFGLLISLSHDVGESGAGDGPHELLRPSRPLLGGFFDHAFAMLPPVEHRPVDLVDGGALIINGLKRAGQSLRRIYPVPSTHNIQS